MTMSLEDQGRCLLRDDIVNKVSAALLGTIASAYVEPALTDPTQQACRIALVQSVVADPSIREQIIQLALLWVVGDPNLDTPDDITDATITGKITLTNLDTVAQAIGQENIISAAQTVRATFRTR